MKKEFDPDRFVKQFKYCTVVGIMLAFVILLIVVCDSEGDRSKAKADQRLEQQKTWTEEMKNDF